jgi:hypothetical protein
MRASATVLTVVLLVLPLLIYPVVEAAPPKVLTTFSGTLGPGAITSFSWNLSRDVTDFLFHYKITGGTDPLDVAYVSIDETGDHWDYLMGEGWADCDCPLNASTYTVTIEVDAAATGPIAFVIGFHLAPQPPVDFTGFIPANSDTRYSSFGATFPSTTSYTLMLGITSGSYEFFVDGTSQTVVTGNTQVSLDFEEGSFHLFEVSSLSVGAGEDVRWNVQVQGQPKLEVRIVNPCPVLNPESGQSVCVVGAEATASDGGSPTVSYLWTASGGEFNSTTSRWVQWTAPAGVASFTLTLQASASGYVSDSDSLSVQVVPEFPSVAVPLLLVLLLALMALARPRNQSKE